jgi:hypothetical protein
VGKAIVTWRERLSGLDAGDYSAAVSALLSSAIALLDRCDACEVIRAAEEAKRKRMLLLKQKLLKKKKVVMNKTIPFFVSFNDWYYQLLQNYHHHHHHPDTPLFFD